MANKNLKRSTSLATKEMQIKITMRFHYAPIKMPKKKKMIILTVGEDEGKPDYSYIVDRKKMCQSLWKTIQQFLLKFNMHLLYLAITLLGIYLAGMRNCVHTKTKHGCS